MRASERRNTKQKHEEALGIVDDSKEKSWHGLSRWDLEKRDNGVLKRLRWGSRAASYENTAVGGRYGARRCTNV